jgi:hypothetical protein
MVIPLIRRLDSGWTQLTARWLSSQVAGAQTLMQDTLNGRSVFPAIGFCRERFAFWIATFFWGRLEYIIIFHFKYESSGINLK